MNRIIKRKRNLYLFILLFSIIQVSYSQSDDFNEGDNVSYDFFSDSNEELKIPLYTVELENLRIPIYLLYNTQGRKNSDVPSSVGYGWSLIAGGKIEKTINHIPDESYWGWFNKNITTDISGVYNHNDPQGSHYFKKLDVSPDYFDMKISNGDYLTYLYNKDSNYNLNYNIYSQNDSYSIITDFEKLAYDYDEQYLENDFDVLVRKNYLTEYYFRKGLKRKYPRGYARDNYIDSVSVSDFYLHKVKSTKNFEEINFKYEKNELKKHIIYAHGNDIKTNSNGANNPPNPSDPYYTAEYFQDVSIEDVKSKIVSEISSSREIIKFKYIEKQTTYITDNNLNLVNAGTQIQNFKLLDEIEIYDHLKRYKYGYRFEYTTQSPNQEDFEGFYKIKRIYRVASNKINTRLLTEFNYYPQVNSINPFSPAQDVFGYPNTAVSNGVPYGPNNDIRNITPISYKPYQSQGYPIADRMPNLDRMKQGMLKQIINENRGITLFEYQENSHSYFYFGGLLVSKISKFDEYQNKIFDKNFIYDDPQGFGLPIYFPENYSDGDEIPFLYDEGFFNTLNYDVPMKPWHTFFTKKYIDLPNTSYKFRNSPYGLLEVNKDYNTIYSYPEIEDQQKHGSFFQKVTEFISSGENSNIINGSIIKYYKPSYTAFTRSGILSKIEIKNRSNNKVKEILYEGELVVQEPILSDYYFDNWISSIPPTNTNDIGIPSYSTVYKIKKKYSSPFKNIIKSKMEYYYTDEGVFKYYKKFEYDYLYENDLSNADFFKEKEVRYFHNSTSPHRKKRYKYFKEFNNQFSQYLFYYNPLVQETDWVIRGNQEFLEKGNAISYDEFGNIKKIHSIHAKNPSTNTAYNLLNFQDSYFNSNNELVTNGDILVEYNWSQSRNLNSIKDFKNNKSILFQRDLDELSLYVDAILEIPGTNISPLKQFKKISFEENTFNDTGKKKLLNAFSGQYVFTGKYLEVNEYFSNNSIITYWSYKNNKWIFNKVNHPGGNLILNISADVDYIDEVIIRPPDSRLKSYSYNYLIGKTSNIDENGFGERIKYDGFGRIKYYFDEQTNVVNEKFYKKIDQ